MRELTARPRHVYVICTEVPPNIIGGLGRYAERMMPALGALGVPVTVFGGGARHLSPRTERIGDVTLRRVRTPCGGFAERAKAPKALRHLARIIELLVFNLKVVAHILRAEAGKSGAVVAVHDWMGCLAGILCRTLGRMPVVFHVHSCERNADPSLRRSTVAAGIGVLENHQAGMAHLIVVPSVRMRDDLTTRGWHTNRLRVIPHGFEDPELLRLADMTDEDCDRTRAVVRKRYLPNGDGKLIVFAGRLAPHKGVRTLIQAAARLIEDRDDVRIVLIGAPVPRTEDKSEIARLIFQLGIGRHVIADHGFMAASEVFAHFMAADVCAFPSTYEPFGLVAVEAMALGSPVVVGPGYSPEVVGDGARRCGQDSPEELATALRWCLDHPECARRLARHGARYVRERYTWSRTARLTLAAYGEAVR